MNDKKRLFLVTFEVRGAVHRMPVYSKRKDAIRFAIHNAKSTYPWEFDGREASIIKVETY